MRGTNSGMTCLIDVTGKIIDPMEPFKTGWHIYDVPVYTTETNGETLYTTHDDWFAFGTIYLSAFLLALGVIRGIVMVVRSRKKD